MCDKHDRSDLLGSPKKLLFSVAILLSISSAGHAETIIKGEFRCFHLETLERFDQLVVERGGQAALDFMGDQMMSGECSGFLKVGTSVRVDKRIKRPNGETDVCIVPFGSSEPCQWVSSEVIK
jgi:hypothetical protein